MDFGELTSPVYHPRRVPPADPAGAMATLSENEKVANSALLRDDRLFERSQ